MFRGPGIQIVCDHGIRRIRFERRIRDFQISPLRNAEFTAYLKRYVFRLGLGSGHSLFCGAHGLTAQRVLVRSLT